jgi:diguanylate cyclase (GGDEF)-like protein
VLSLTVILPGCAPDAALRIAQALRRCVEAFEFEAAGHTFRIGASIGVTAFGDGSDPTAVMHAADTACYRAKAAGRNAVCVAEDDAETGDA